MKKLVRQIRSLGSLRKVSVCMLTRCQKPKATFMAPTYPIGGSDSSYTRQGGIHILLIELAAMVFALLDGSIREKRKYSISWPYSAGYFIDFQEQFSFTFSLFPTPEVMRKS